LRNSQDTITLRFDNPDTINTVWVYAYLNDPNGFAFNDIRAKNPEGVFESIINGAFYPGQSFGPVFQIRADFPNTNYPVEELQVLISVAEGQDIGIDAVAVGDNGIELPSMALTGSSVISDTIVNIFYINTLDPNVAKFVIERSTSESDGFVIIDSLNAVQEETLLVNFVYSDRNAPPGPGPFFYRARSTDTLGVSSDFSNVLRVDKIIPGDDPAPSVFDPPTELVATQANLNTIGLRWADNADGEIGYIIEFFDPDLGFYETLDTLFGDFSDPTPVFPQFVEYFHTSEDFVFDTTYSYQVEALADDSVTRSGISNEASVKFIEGLMFERIIDDPVVNDVSAATYAANWGDVDGDGDLDLYVHNWRKVAFTNDISQAPAVNYFYENNGDGTFTKVTEGPLAVPDFESRAGTWGDMDNDGDLDLVINATSGELNKFEANPIYLFINDGGDFTQTVIDPNDFGSTGFDKVAVADFNNDGLLDIFTGSIFFNLGNNQFDRLSRDIIAPGLPIGETAPSVGTPDYNNDGLVDIFVAGDNGVFLFENIDGITFQQVDAFSEATSARGSAWADFDNDGDFDLIIGAEGQNDVVYFRNDSTGFTSFKSADLFDEIPRFNRGFTVIDFNNDGREDLIAMDAFTLTPTLFENLGVDPVPLMRRVPQEETPFVTGQNFVSTPAVADYDGDGFQDFFSGAGFSSNDRNRLYRNLCVGGVAPNNWIRFELDGIVSNEDGIGSQITVFPDDGPTVFKQVTATEGTWSGNEITVHVGLDQSSSIDSIYVDWPSGGRSLLTDVDVNQTIVVSEADLLAAIDREALTRFYNESGGPEGNWIRDANWTTSADLEDWEGVEVNDDGLVVAVRLANNGIRHTASGAILGLSFP
jgi:hypothetical protein